MTAASPTRNPLKDFPPDPEDMNDDRADWAEAALIEFRRITGTDDEDALGDLLCDLMHWSDRNGGDFENALRLARLHYDAETAPEPSDFCLSASGREGGLTISD